VITGDFNCPDIDWNGLNVASHTSPLLEWSLNNFLSQNVSCPTRPQSQNILDLVFSDVSTTIEEVSVHECFGSSDHAIVTFDVLFPFTQRVSQHRNIRLYNNGNWRRFNQIIQNSHWPNVFTHSDVDSLWSEYLRIIEYAIESSIPVKPKKLWTYHNSSKVRSALRRLRRSHKVYEASPSLKNKIALQLSQWRLDQNIKKVTLAHEKLISSQLASNSKQFWSYVNTKIRTGVRQYSLSTDSGDKVTDHGRIAEMFNSYFALSFSQRDTYSLPDASATCANETFDRVRFSPKLVHDVVKKLPNSTSCDNDGLCYTIVKRAGMFLSTKLSELFNLSMTTRKIPTRWKKITVTPIFKSGARDKYINYRPIAVTSCILRIMERIICRQLLSFLQENDLLLPTQHGFTPNKSVETAQILFYEYLTRNLDVGQTVHVAYLDFSKAFDTVPHKLLLNKLSRLGITGMILSWLEDYLSERSQSVRISHHLSEPISVISGVIQGSVLGPVLFLMYVNDLDSHVKNSFIIKYADDVKIATTCNRNVEDEMEAIRGLQSDLDSIHSWSARNGLSLNPGKCKVMTFGPSNVLRQLHISDDALEAVSHFKDLGVLVSSPLGFNAYISSICLSANRKLGIIKRCFITRDVKLLLTLYKQFVRPTLEFSSVIWCPYRKKNIDLLERVQKRFCRLFKALRSLSYEEQLKELGLLSLSARRLRYKLIFLYKVLTYRTCFQPTQFFQLSPCHLTRGNSLKLLLPHSKHDYRSKFFTIDTITHWNSLSDTEINVETVNTFKHSISSYFHRTGIW
jgi:hypothetical protein